MASWTLLTASQRAPTASQRAPTVNQRIPTPNQRVTILNSRVRIQNLKATTLHHWPRSTSTTSRWIHNKVKIFLESKCDNFSLQFSLPAAEIKFNIFYGLVVIKQREFLATNQIKRLLQQFSYLDTHHGGEYELVKHTVGSIQTLNMVISAEQIVFMETKYHKANK